MGLTKRTRNLLSDHNEASKGQKAPLVGLWRCTSATFATGELDEDDEPAWDDPKTLSATAVDCTNEEWTADFEENGPAAYYLELRHDGRMREVDLGRYPQTRRKQRWDDENADMVSQMEEVNFPIGLVSKALGFDFSYNGSYSTEAPSHTVDNEGFGRIQAGVLDLNTKAILRIYDGNEHVFDHVELRDGLLHRTASIVWDGIYVSSFALRYERLVN